MLLNSQAALRSWNGAPKLIVLMLHLSQAFINTARKIYEKIEQGVFDVSNEVPPRAPSQCSRVCGRLRVRT